jgi:hypothetical protein
MHGFGEGPTEKGSNAPRWRPTLLQSFGVGGVKKFFPAVLPLSVVDNSDFSADRLTVLETLLMLATQGAYQAPHFKQ